MRISEFKLERYFALHEFRARYLLSASDCEALGLDELLALADSQLSALWNGLRLSYTESQGHPLLRAEIARLYSTLSADHILVAAPEELIFILMNVLLAPGDQVIVASPAYQSLHEIARALGCDITPWPVELQDVGWRLDPEVLHAAITSRTKLLVVNFPHNPTGYLPEQEQFAAILAVARQHGIYVFSDEMYRLLEYDPARRLPPAADLYERAISLSGLSKTFSLPGLRLGWLAMQDRRLLSDLLAFHDYTTICNSAPAEILGIIALRAKDRIVRRNLDIIRTNLAAFDRFSTRNADLMTPLPPQAGSVGFPRLRPDLPVAAFCRALLDEKDVMIVPGHMFGHPGNHFRIGLGRTDFPQGLARVQEYLSESGLS